MLLILLIILILVMLYTCCGNHSINQFGGYDVAKGDIFGGDNLREDNISIDFDRINQQLAHM
jgi:hypothetical protein